jgi:hypothetical protein
VRAGGQQLLQADEYGADRLDQGLPHRGELVDPPVPDQQRVAEEPPQPGQRGTHRGLADADRLGGPGDVPLLQQRIQRDDEVQVHPPQGIRDIHTTHPARRYCLYR